MTININREEFTIKVNERLTIVQLCEYFKCSNYTIITRKKKWGLKGINSTNIVINKSEFIALVNKGMNIDNLANHFKCSIKTIQERKRLWKQDINKNIRTVFDGTKETLDKILQYNKDTGIFIWKENRGKAKIGDIAGYIKGGYLNIEINGKTYSATRLAFCIVEGTMPDSKECKIKFKDSNITNMSYKNLIKIPFTYDSNAYSKRVKEQTPKNVNKKLMKAIWKNCPKGWHVDHIHPLSKGGLNEPNNLQYLTQNDNNRKSSKANFKNYIINPIKWQDIINENEYKIL